MIDLGVIVAWDGADPPDYVHPLAAGERVEMRRDGSSIRSRVVRVDGYGPDVVELEHNVRVDLAGWHVKRGLRDGETPCGCLHFLGQVIAECSGPHQ